MGRPPLQVKAMKVRLPEGIGERIDTLVGLKRRAEFIRDAVVAEVERREAETVGTTQGQAPKPPTEPVT